MASSEDITAPERSGPVVDAASTIGTTIGAYRIVDVLAAGGFGVVYRAEDVDRGVPVALKILHRELGANVMAVARFEREVEAIQRVRHPNVIKVQGSGRLPDGRPYFVMELLEGQSLKEHLEARGPLSIGEALAILEPLCEAVGAAHAQAIVHRDIKASNVFLSEEGDGRRVVLLDFGVAKLLDAEGPGITSSRHIVGTIACMAPEQLLARPVDERTDVYALGALAYRMLTGAPPFAARTPVALQQMHLYATPRPPSAMVLVSPKLNAPVLRAMSKEPSARQQSAAAFLAELLAAAVRGPLDQERRALAVYVEISLPPDAMDAPDEALLSDLEGIFPAACAALEPAGFKAAMLTGTSALLTLALPDDPVGEVEARRAGVGAAIKLGPQLAGRPGRHERVYVLIRVHAAIATIDASGAVAGGPIMELAAWAPEIVAEGLLASAPALAGIDVARIQAGETAGVIWSKLPG